MSVHLWFGTFDGMAHAHVRMPRLLRDLLLLTN
jgi:hypothetical protein